MGNSEESKKEDMRGLVLGYKIETLTAVVERNRERAPSLQQHHAIDENTVCGLQIVLRLLIFFVGTQNQNRMELKTEI